MSLITSILTGGSNNHETTSEEANAVFTDFVSEGIVDTIGNTSGVAPATGGFAVNADSGMNLTVAAGIAYVDATPTSQNAQTFRVKNTGSEALTISANSSGSTKYDWVYLKLDPTNLNTPNTAGDNAATIVTSRSSSAASDDGTPPTYAIPLAVVTVANGASSITNGNIRDVRTQVSVNTGSTNSNDGWTALSTPVSVSTGYNKGNKEYDLTFTSSMASILSPGMRLKTTRAITPPTQCADLEASSSHYASRASGSLTGISFTDDVTCEAWVKLESYAAGAIVSRWDGTSGWILNVNSSGQLALSGINSGAGNQRNVTSLQSLPLNQWVHVAVTLDMSGWTTATNKVFINGVDVPATLNSLGTNPTSLAQGSGALQIGAQNAAAFLDGKASDVRVWSNVRTATQIRDNMNQQLVGNESGLVAYFKLNGDFNDSTSNANNLTGQNSAVATNSDNPMNSTEYAIVTKVSGTTVTVFTGTDYNIPNMTLSTPYYSTQDTPFGFPTDTGKWRVESILRNTANASGVVTNTHYPVSALQLNVPTGAWKIGYSADAVAASNSGGAATTFLTMSTSSSSATDTRLTGRVFVQPAGVAATTTVAATVAKENYTSLSSQTIHYVNQYTDNAGTTSQAVSGSNNGCYSFAECAYL